MTTYEDINEKKDKIETMTAVVGEMKDCLDALFMLKTESIGIAGIDRKEGTITFVLHGFESPICGIAPEYLDQIADILRDAVNHRLSNLERECERLSL